jgi:Glycosyl hydrolase family 20, catalytic domain
MKKRTRREFLAGAGVALGGMVVGPRAWGVSDEGGASDAAATHPILRAENTRRMGHPDVGASSAPLRGLMVDAGRVPEKMEYYRRVVEFCAEWEMNALHFRLADDQGSALKFATVPGLVTHRNAFTPDEMHGLAEYGRSHGVDVIPELESFGHTGYITRSPQWAHLADESPDGTAEFTGVIPVSRQTLELFAKLYAEIAEIFPSRYLHTGCDEVNWGGSAESRAALKTKSRAQIWAGYLNKLNAYVNGHGKQMIVWGDFVLHKEPQILVQLEKNIVIMDWQYSENSSAKVAEALERVKANGSLGIGAPALICYKWGPRAGREQLRNIDAFAEVYLGTGAAAAGVAGSGSLGMVLTNWVPSRYVQRSIWDGFAYAAVAMRQGTAVAQTSGLRRFVERHYGARWSDDWDEAMALLYDDAPSVADRETKEWMGMRLVVPWSTDAELQAALKGGVGRNPYIRLRKLLAELAPTVQKNGDDFAALVLSVEAMEMAVARVNAVVEPAQIGGMDEAAAAGLIAQIAEQDAAMVKKLTADWDEGRPADAGAKTELLAELHPKDELLYSWGKAAEYSAELVKEPRKFYGIVTGVR